MLCVCFWTPDTGSQYKARGLFFLPISNRSVFVILIYKACVLFFLTFSICCVFSNFESLSLAINISPVLSIYCHNPSTVQYVLSRLDNRFDPSGKLATQDSDDTGI